MMASSPVMPMSRKDRERARHRREILAVAERLFARKGYRATTVEEIAREAEFAVGTLYILFRDKEDLYLRVIEACAQEFMERFERNIVPMDKAEEAVAALLELRLAHCGKHRDLIRSALEAAPALCVNPIAAAPNPLARIYERYIRAVSGIFRRGISQGVFVQADPLFLALCLEGTLHAFVAHWFRHDHKTLLPAGGEPVEPTGPGILLPDPPAGYFLNSLTSLMTARGPEPRQRTEEGDTT